MTNKPARSDLATAAAHDRGDAGPGGRNARLSLRGGLIGAGIVVLAMLALGTHRLRRKMAVVAAARLCRDILDSFIRPVRDGACGVRLRPRIPLAQPAPIGEERRDAPKRGGAVAADPGFV